MYVWCYLKLSFHIRVTVSSLAKSLSILLQQLSKYTVKLRVLSSSAVEKLQKRATKMLPALKNRPYKDRLQALHYRRTKDHGSIKEIWPETSNAGLSSAIVFFGPGRSLMPTTVVLLLVRCCCYRFRKMPKALLIHNGKLRNLAYTFVTSFPTDLPSQIFHQMAPTSGSIVPFVLVCFADRNTESRQLCRPKTDWLSRRA